MRRSILALLAAAVVVPPASSLAQADAPPMRKPGWWEMQMVVSGPTPEPIRQTLHICTDPAVDQAQSPFGVNMRGGGCAAEKIERTGSGWTITGNCDTGKMKISAEAVATGDLNDRYHVDIVTHMDPPPAAQAAEVKIALDAHWLGECPADRKPGDVEMNGNVLRRPGTGAPPPDGAAPN